MRKNKLLRWYRAYVLSSISLRTQRYVDPKPKTIHTLRMWHFLMEIPSSCIVWPWSYLEKRRLRCQQKFPASDLWRITPYNISPLNNIPDRNLQLESSGYDLLHTRSFIIDLKTIKLKMFLVVFWRISRSYIILHIYIHNLKAIETRGPMIHHGCNNLSL